MEEAKYLMEASNGIKVWVPESKLDEWTAAQKDSSPELTPAEQRLKKAIMERFYGKDK